jgi:hypothetical protein
VADRELLQRVVVRRAEDAEREVRKVYPGAAVSYEIGEDRGVITLTQDRFVVSKEFVETAKSLGSPGRMTEYARVLMGKSRLVLIVPEDEAVRTWLRLLEFNNFWLFYHSIHYYDDNGEIRRVDRRTWRKLRGLPPDDPERSPEVA